MEPLLDTLPLLKTWCQEHPVKLCLLFGSQATGMAKPGSDVDLAIWPIEKTLPTSTRLHWIRELETLLNNTVSLMSVSANLDPVLGMEIVRHGRLIYEREPELWVHHRLQLWHVYNDSLPFIEAARQHLHKFAQEVQRGT